MPSAWPTGSSPAQGRKVSSSVPSYQGCPSSSPWQLTHTGCLSMSARERTPTCFSSGVGATIAPLFPLRLQRFNRLGLFNHFCETQPSVSRRSEFFAMHRVAFGLDHFAFGDLPTFR